MGMLKEFRDFALRGNVFDLAVAFVMGAAFAKIVSSFVDNVMMPPVNADTSPGDLRFLGDLVVALTLNDKLGINLNVDYVKAPPGSDIGGDYVFGFAGMARYVVNDHLNLATRGEWIQTHSDAYMANADVEEGTVMAGIDVGKNFELRPEVRFDHRGQGGTFTSNGKSDQVTGTLAALTWF